MGEGWSARTACRTQLAKAPTSLEGWSLGAVLEQNPRKPRLERETGGSPGHGLADGSDRFTGSRTCGEGGSLAQSVHFRERKGRRGEGKRVCGEGSSPGWSVDMGGRGAKASGPTDLT